MLMLGLAPFVKGRPTTFLYLVVICFFVGFRYETGFDWPVYKRIFLIYADGFSFGEIVFTSGFFGQEPGFLLSLAIGAVIFPNYEYVQAVYTLFLIYSIICLSRTVGVKNTALVVALALSFVIFTLGFSTVRQSLAIAIFNIGFALSLSGKTKWSYLVYGLSATFQLSVLVYLAAILVSRVMVRGNGSPNRGRFFVLCIASPVVLAILMQSAALLPGILGAKIAFYAEDFSFTEVNLLDLYLVLGFALIAWHVSVTGRREALQDPMILRLRIVIFTLAAIAISSTFVDVFRDRVSYELVILYSVYLGTVHVNNLWLARVSLGIFGSAFSIYFLTSTAGQLAFVPYQIALISIDEFAENDGKARQTKLFETINRDPPCMEDCD